MTDEQEKLPKHSVAEVARWRSKLSGLLVGYAGMALSGNQLILIAWAVVDTIAKKASKRDRSLLPIHKEDDHVYMSVYYTLLAHAGGAIVTSENVQYLSKILAGNIHLLRAGVHIPVWKYQLAPEWVLVKVVDTYRTVTPRKQIQGHILNLEILTGNASSHIIHQFATDGMLGRMARKLGIRNIKNRKVVHPRELTMCYFMVKLKEGEKLECSEYRETSSLNTRNRKRAVQRGQYKQLCPIGSKWPCFFCRMSYSDCVLACHPDEYVRGTCRNGHSGWVARRPEPLCMACQQRSWISKHGGRYEEQESSSVCATPSTAS